MPEAEWSPASLLIAIAAAPAKNPGHYLDFGTILQKAPDQNPREIALMLSALGDVDLIRVRKDVVDFVSLETSRNKLDKFAKAMKKLATPDKSGQKVLSEFRSEFKHLAKRQLAATPVPSGQGHARHYHFHIEVV